MSGEPASPISVTINPKRVLRFLGSAIALFALAHVGLIILTYGFDRNKIFWSRSGVFYYAWVTPYTLIAAVVGLLYIRFLLRLPRGTSVRFVISGCVFVGGAIGVELFQGDFQETYGFRSVLMDLSFLVEEPMEMFGTAFFIYAALRFLNDRSRLLRIKFTIGAEETFASAAERPGASRLA